MRKVVLFLYDIELLEINEGEELLITEHKKNVSMAKELYPLQMRYYKKGLSGMLYPLEIFLNVKERADLVTASNNQFEFFYKVAGLDIEPINGFYLKIK